jgi:uncharacterized protein (TIGR04255 family)
MVEYSLLPNAPITEALIDIRIKVRTDFDVNRLESLYDEISTQYSAKKARHKIETKLEFKEGQPLVSEGKEKIDGYLFTSVDGKQIFQAAVDGFTFNRLRPYDKWEIFRNEAFRLWGLYRKLLSPEIIRVGLRYVNRLNIPLSAQHVFDFDDYLTAGPAVPKELPQGLSSFLTRIVINDPDIDSSGIITQALDQIVDPKFVPIILDIDVFKQKEVITEEEAWHTLEQLRHFKNRIFFASITNKAKELFQ